MIGDLDKAFESRVRIGIMAVLVVNTWVDHAHMRDLLDVTDGNLASHIAALEKAAYVEVRKRFVGRRPNTGYKCTTAGKRAFQAHLDALERLLNKDLRP